MGEMPSVQGSFPDRQDMFLKEEGKYLKNQRS